MNFLKGDGMKSSKIFKTFLFVTFYMTLLLILIGCTKSQNQAPSEKTMMQKIYVEEIDSQKVIAKTEELQVIVKGNLPNPAYTFDHFDVQVKDNVIEITPLAKYDAGKIVAQVLVPFEEVCKVENLKPGTYEIKVNSRVETVKMQKPVQVKD